MDVRICRSTMGLFAMLCAAATGSAHAQSGSSKTAISDGNARTVWCVNDVTQPGGTNIQCDATSAVGDVSLRSITNLTSRTLTSSVGTLQTGPSLSFSTYLEALTKQSGSVVLMGTSGAADQLAFHFLSQTSQVISNISADAGWTASVSIAGPGGTVSTSGQAVPDGTPGGFQVFPLQPTFDMFVPVHLFSGSLLYSLFGYTWAGTGAGNTGERSGSSVQLTLDSVELRDGEGRLLQTASFDAVGNGAIDLTATPEPASLTLLVTGLVGVFGAARRRRSRLD